MITSVTLQSARLEQRTSFAAGFVEDDRLLLFPVDEVPYCCKMRCTMLHCSCCSCYAVLCCAVL
jgi:hypothetical protein